MGKVRPDLRRRYVQEKVIVIAFTLTAVNPPSAYQINTLNPSSESLYTLVQRPRGGNRGRNRSKGAGGTPADLAVEYVVLHGISFIGNRILNGQGLIR